MALLTNRLTLEDVGTGPPNQLGQLVINSGKFQLRDGLGTYDPRTVWFSQHRDDPQLAHLLDRYAGSAPYRVITGQPFPTQIADYFDANLTVMASKEVLTRDGLQRVTMSVLTIYASDGTTVVSQATRAITYTGLWATQIVTTRSV